MNEEDKIVSLKDASVEKSQEPGKVQQHVKIKEEPEVVESETSQLEEESEIDVPEDLIVKEESQLTESHQASTEDTAKKLRSSTPHKSPSFKCYICRTMLRTKSLLNDHLMNDHEVQESYRCEECKSVFNQILPYNNHLAKHGGDRRFKCSYCSLRFNGLQNQLQHESKRHGIEHGETSPKKPQCDICGQAFSNKDNLKRHVRVKHKGDVRPKAPPLASRGGTGRSVPTCNVCQATFQHSKEVVTHFQKVHPEKDFKSYPCTKCDEVFFLATTIVTHRYIHTDKFACDRCQKRHTSKQDLVRHLHVVHKVPYNEDRYRECQVCHQQIRDYNFSAHQRVHRNDGPLPCEHCGKSYKSSFSLNNHNKRCQNEKPLASRTGGKSRTQPKCEVCQAVFEHVNEVEPHFKLVHPDKELKIYPCTICGDILFSYFMLFRHRYIHSEKFACDLCDETLQSKDDLARHRRSVHSVKPDKEFFTTCELCDHRFSRPDYRRHIKSEKHKLNLARSLALKQQK